MSANAIACSTCQGTGKIACPQCRPQTATPAKLEDWFPVEAERLRKLEQAEKFWREAMRALE